MYNLVGFSGCLHLWWIPLLTPELLTSELCVISVTMNPFSLTTRLALNKFQASCYSHHRSQSALDETNWPLRASGYNLTLNPYLVIQMGHHHRHPLTRAMELRPDHWSATPEVSPRGSRELHTDTDPTIINQQWENTNHVYNSMSTSKNIIPHSYHMLNPYHWSLPPHEYRASSHIITMSHKFQLTH